jgi:peptidoglycan/xylan/chitin deacetylase (PgdA/CDA1 family)
MKLISPLLKRVVYPSLSQTGYLRRYARGGQLCVVTYHGVRPTAYEAIDHLLDGSLVTRDVLRSQLRLLKSRYNVVSPQEVRQWLEHQADLPSRAVLLTCDDGLKNTLTEMLPVLNEERVSCLFFVTAASTCDVAQMLWYEELYLMLGAAPAGILKVEELGIRETLTEKNERRGVWWQMVKLLSRYDPSARVSALMQIRKGCGLPEDWQAKYQDDRGRSLRFNLLTLQELRELAAGGMSIGAHTLSHPILPQASEQLAWREVAESREVLEKALQISVWAMAYPFGDPASVTAREIQMARQAGYGAAFVNFGGGFGSHVQRFAIPRVHVTADMTLGEFEAHVSGFYLALRTRFSRQETIRGSQA